VEKHPRFLADLTGDGRGAVVGFGNAGVWVAINEGAGTSLERGSLQGRCGGA
jgi:hypothetical protein